MNDQRLKSLDEYSDESEQFEERFLKLNEVKGDGSARKELIDDIVKWLQECTKQGRFIPIASPDRRAFRSMVERWKSRLRTQGALIAGIDRLADFDPNAGIVLKQNCPYPGLEPYGEDQRSGFFGRESLVSSSVEHLEQQGNQILLIIGASGTGKSSAALAGILPQLKEDHSKQWSFGSALTPGANPMAALSTSVAQAIGHSEKAKEIEGTLTTEPDNALGQLANWCEKKTLMLLIDQFEETFTLCHDTSKKSAFAKVLFALSDPTANVNNFSCRILLTLRTDQLARFESSDDFNPLYSRLLGEKNDHHRYLSAISFDDIKRAIKKPADAVGLRFIPASLIDRIASQTAGLTNGLPLLQFSLRRLWKTRPKNENGEPLDLVTEKMVKDLPDVERALGTVADNIFSKLSATQQKICERLLLELIVLDEGFEEPLRRRRNESQLRQVLASLPGNEEDIDRVINVFVKHGLLRRFNDASNSHIEVAHEALLRHWEHIYRLLMGADVKERLHLVKQIGRQARYWMSHNKSLDYLALKGDPLKRAIEYKEENWLVEAEATAYVAACTEQEDKYRRNRITLWATAVIIVIFAIISYSNQQREIAETASSVANLVSDGYYYLQTENISTAKQKFEEAFKIADKNTEAIQMGLGLIYLQENNHKEAKTHFDDLISSTKDKEKTDSNYKNPTLYTYYYHRGKSLYGLKKFSEANSDLNEAINLLNIRNPADSYLYKYYYDLGLSHRSIKKLQKAKEAFLQAIKLLEDKDQNDEVLGKYYYYLGLSHRDLRDMNSAEDAFKQGIFSHRWAEAVYRDGLGKVYLIQGKVEDAMDQFRQAIEIDKNEAGYHFHLGKASFQFKNFEDASNQFEQAIQLSENKVKENQLSGKIIPDIQDYRVNLARVSLAQVSLALRRFRKAEQICKDIIANPDLEKDINGTVYTLLGNALSAQNRHNEAIDAYTKALMSNQKDAWGAALYLADAYVQNREPSKAKEYLKIAEELFRKDPQFQVQAAKDFFYSKKEEIAGKLSSL